MMQCLICHENINYRDLGGSTEIICPRCTTYKVSSTSFSILRQKELSQRQITNISGWLRENTGYIISSDGLKKLEQIRTPSLFDRADKLLVNIENMSSYAGEVFQSDSSWLAMAWAVNDEELSEIISYLISADRLTSVSRTLEAHDVKISPAGWAYLDSIKNVNAQSVQGFVAMWFDDGMREVYEDAISVGIEKAGYKPHRVDLREHNEKIDDEIIAQIRKSRFVLADFTGHRGGVYYEAGYAKGLGLEVIWTCREDQLDALHFDIRQYNCIVWRQDDLSDFCRRIQFRIEAVLGQGLAS
jgi:nucleoside 2-deoxyribosyltransferase